MSCERDATSSKIFHAGVQRLRKTLFFGQQGARHGVLRHHQLGVGFAHQFDQRGHHLAEERLAHAQHPTMAQRTSDNPTQHIAAAFVGGQHTIDDEKRTSADVIGDHPQRFVLQIGDAGQRAGLADQRLEQVDFIVRMDMLQDRGKTLQSHASVHAWRWQRYQCAVGLAIELHEDQVPDLDKAVAILIRRPRRTTSDVIAVVEENFGTRAARAGVGHLPEIIRRVGRTLVVADAHDAAFRDADHVAPQRKKLLRRCGRR